jgi:hypothetical protein
VIITVQGMNHKNNKAVQTVSTLAGMDSLVNGNKVLIMQLINPDIDTADNTLNKNTDILYGSEKSSFAETGIDSLLRICSGTVIGANEFEQLCTPIRKTKFALDVCEISKNVEFTKTVVSRVEDIKEILNSATQVYQNIYILVDSKDDDVLKTVNELDVVNRSVYCLRQGHMNKGAVYGKNIFYIVTDYHEDSEFSIKAMKNAYVSRKEPIYSLAFNIHATDASMKGRLIHFILHNMNNEKTDVNYEWCKSVKDILIAIENMKEAKEKTSNKDIEEFKPASDTEDYSKFNENAGLIQNVPLVKDIKEPVPAPKKEKKGFFLFGRKKKTEQPKPQEKEELLDLSLNNDFDEDETVDIGADVKKFHTETNVEPSIEPESIEPVEEAEVEPEVKIPAPTVKKTPAKKTTATKKTPVKKVEEEAVEMEEAEPVVKKAPAKKATAKKVTSTSATETKSAPAKKTTTTAKAKTATAKTTTAKTAVKKTTAEAEEVKPVAKKATASKTTATKDITAKTTTKKTTATKTTATKSTAKTTAKKTTKKAVSDEQ